MATYRQPKGILKVGNLIGVGYSGDAAHRNNPDSEKLKDEGPIPRGSYKVTALFINTPKHGPFVLQLTPDPETETWGRSGFLCHGDNVKAPGTASEGCIIMPRAVREAWWNSGDKDLQVTL